MDPELGALARSQVAVVCAPLCRHTNAGTRSGLPPAPGGAGAGSARCWEGGPAGRKGGTRLWCGCGGGGGRHWKAVAPLPQQPRSGRPAQRRQRGAARRAPVALRSLPALMCSQDERERKKVHLKEQGRAETFAGSNPRGGLWSRGRGSCRAMPGVIMREDDRECSRASAWVELPKSAAGEQAIL